MRKHNTRSSLTNMIKAFAMWALTFRATFFLTAQKNLLSDDTQKIASIKNSKNADKGH